MVSVAAPSMSSSRRTSRVALSALAVVLTYVSLGSVGCADDADTPHPTPIDTTDSSSGSDTATDGSVVDSGTDTNKPDTNAADSGADSKVDTGTDASDAKDASDADASEVATDAGTAADCFPTTGTDSIFTLVDTSLCVVAQYTVPVGSVSSLTWGRHGGPLGFDSSDASAPKLVRWKAPTGTTGALTQTTTTITVPSVPSGAYWDSQALDLPFYDWTAIAYAGTGTAYPGELILAPTTGSLVRYHVNGYFSESAVGLAASGGRLVYTGLSPLSTSASTTNAGGLYAADRCGSATSSPRLLPDGDTTCGDAKRIATWEGGSSGPVTSDPDENVFAILSTFGGNQELRGFEKGKIARGGAATDGTKLFSMTGYTSEMVADGSKVVFQPYDGTTYAALDVQAVDYTVSASAGTVTPSGSVRAVVKFAAAGTSAALLVDDQRRLWVGVANPGVGDAGPTTSTFYVLRKKTP